MNIRKAAFVVLSFFIFQGRAFSGVSQDLEFFDFEKASFDEILNIKTEVASRTGLLPARQSPGILTVMTREEILNSGARNLMDLLRLVPGLDFGVDVESSLGLGVRGNWSYEGKLLVLVDGLRYNESFLGTVQLERFSAEQIERIEIIRGPGSAVYGGFAELGVLNIITRSAKSINGAEAALSYGYMSKTYGGRNINLAFGKAYESAEISAQFSGGDSNKSDRRYTDFNGGSYSMADAARGISRNLNLAVTTNGLNLRFIADIYRTTQQDHYDDTILTRPFDRNYDAYLAGASRRFELSEKMSVTPALQYSHYEPFTGFDAVEYPRDKVDHFLQGSLLFSYKESEKTNLSWGTEISYDKAVAADTTPEIWYFTGGKKSVAYTNTAFFFEGMSEFPFGMVTAGARYDKHQKFESAFVPRLALTKVFEKYHFKAIYSKAFRAPGIDNLFANPDLKPEKTTVLEFETGYKLKENMFLSANIFDIRIKDPIVFYVEGVAQRYGNYGNAGTRGCEFVLRRKEGWGYADLTYSHYIANDNTVDFHKAGAKDDVVLALPANKLTLNSSIKAAKDLSINPSAVYYNERYGYYAAGKTKRFGDILLLNLYLSFKNIFKEGMELGIGAYDIFNSAYSYLQPYNGGHAPLPGPSREFRTRLSYKF